MVNDLAIERTRDEQIRAATLLLTGHADVRGLRQAVTDWVAEEMLILTQSRRVAEEGEKTGNNKSFLSACSVISASLRRGVKKRAC